MPTLFQTLQAFHHTKLFLGLSFVLSLGCLVSFFVFLELACVIFVRSLGWLVSFFSLGWLVSYFSISWVGLCPFSFHGLVCVLFSIPWAGLCPFFHSLGWFVSFFSFHGLACVLFSIPWVGLCPFSVPWVGLCPFFHYMGCLSSICWHTFQKEGNWFSTPSQP